MNVWEEMVAVAMAASIPMEALSASALKVSKFGKMRKHALVNSDVYHANLYISVRNKSRK